MISCLGIKNIEICYHYVNFLENNIITFVQKNIDLKINENFNH